MRQLTVYHEPSSNDEPHILSFQEHVAEMRRSQFRLVRDEEGTEPVSIPFRAAPSSRQHVRIDRGLVQRALNLKARATHANQSCPSCHRVTVEPVELYDDAIARNGAVIQGSATLIGFHCRSCGCEWSA
ncbi:MAG: hypothetical protein R3C18_13570 [Planctomycetaceae bacterium]